jgi:glucose-6-phosphate isomerase
MTISIDYPIMLAPAVSGGISEQAWTDAAPRFRTAHAGVETKRAAGALGFIDLVDDAALLAASVDYARGRKGKDTDVVILGIGGSALGPVALRTALRPSAWNMLDDAARGGFPRLHVLDNVDPVTIAALLDRVALARTLFIVTSKSGGTAETMAQYLIVRDRLAASGDAKWKERLVFVTDPEKGALRPIARAEGIAALPIPPNVGGRFSVLTPVGTLPAALIGIDVVGLLGGARAMRDHCRTEDLSRNPAGVFGVLQWLADTQAGKHVNVLMPYSDPLRDLAAWFVQLWAESLGKIRPDKSHAGPTPLPALGATDQHSQVQLFMEGPADKTISFVAVKNAVVDVTIPKLHGDVPDLAYLGGHSLFELLSIEQRATAGALATRGRPNLTIVLDSVDAWHVGGLMMLLELATAYAGELYGIDAFNQPGVELGKQFAYAMLGRPGAEAARREWDQLPKPDPKRIVQ